MEVGGWCSAVALAGIGWGVPFHGGGGPRWRGRQQGWGSDVVFLKKKSEKKMAKNGIVQDWPPNIEEIRAVLPVSERNIFAYGEVIYSPGSPHLPEWLIAHEEVHFQQQDGEPDVWWRRFLADPAFRLEQELEAHRVEFRFFCKENRDRNARSRYLRELGRRLSAPMYGGIITAREAIQEIQR